MLNDNFGDEFANLIKKSLFLTKTTKVFCRKLNSKFTDICQDCLMNSDLSAVHKDIVIPVQYHVY